MQRRRYLALLTLAFGGCNSMNGGGETTDSKGTGTRTRTRTTATPTDAPTPTDTATATRTREPTETTTRPTDTETETPTPVPDVDSYVADARDALSRAYDAYLGQVEDSNDLTDIESRFTFKPGLVTRWTDEADAALDHASDSDPSRSERELIDRLRDVATALDRFAIAQNAAATGYTRTERAFETIYTEEDVWGAKQRLRKLDGAAESISDALGAFGSSVRPGDFDTVTFMDGREFREKREQLRGLAESFRTDFAEKLSDLDTGFQKFRNGVRTYSNEHYAAAAGYLDDAIEQFEAVRKDWSAVDAVDSFDDLVGSFVVALRKLIDGTEKLSEAASEYKNESGAVEQLQAKHIYKQNDDVARMPTVQRVLDL